MNQVEKEKQFRLKIKKGDLAKLIHGLGLYLKEKAANNFEGLGESDYHKRKQILYLQRLVRTYQGKTGRPDEYGFWSWHRLSIDAFNLKVDELLKKVPDPLEL